MFVNFNMHRILLSILLTTSLFSKEIIAVLDLEQIGLTPQEAKILTQRLTTELISLDKYQVVERNNMDKILKEQKFQHSGCTDSECAVEIGQLLNCDFIVIGSVNKFGDIYAIDARLIDVGLGKGKISAKFSKTGKVDVLLTTGMISIAKQLCGINERDTNISESRLKKSITLIPGSVNKTWPSEGIEQALWAMRDNSQLSTFDFLIIIGKEARIEYNNWENRSKKMGLFGLGAGGVGVGMLWMTSSPASTLFWGFVSIAGIMSSMKVSMERKTMEDNTNLLDWTDKHLVENWVTKYNNKISKASEASIP